MADRDRPASAPMEAQESFLRRWSRRKAVARSAPDAASPVAADDPSPTEAASAPLPEAPAQQGELRDLPDIESLTAGSDFKAFMRPGVPAHLRALALRKLWRSDPSFSKLDGLVEYGKDYTLPSWPKGAINTAYRIGRGFVNELEKLQEGKAAPLEQPDGEPAPAIASSVDEAPAEAPLDPPRPAREPAASNDRQSATSAPAAPAAASAPAERRRRPLPRRG